MWLFLSLSHILSSCAGQKDSLMDRRSLSHILLLGTCTALVLDSDSQDLLLTHFGHLIPAEWKVYAHHMTICVGELGVLSPEWAFG